LVSGRVFTQSPHIQDGDIQKSIFISIPLSGAEQVSIVSAASAQEELQSTNLGHALAEDSSLGNSKIFHWRDKAGINYWLPVMEVMRSIFAKSPEMTRALLLFDGWSELVEEWNIENDVLNIFCTAEPKISDIGRLAWIASEPDLLKAWYELEKFIPLLRNGFSPVISWPFKQPFTLQVFGKSKGNHRWISEISNFQSWPMKYSILHRNHPDLYRVEVDESLNPEFRANDSLEELFDEEFTKEIITETTIGSNNKPISRPKQFTHIQSAQYDYIDSIKTVDNRVENSAPSTTKKDADDARLSAQEVEVAAEGALSDNISGEKHFGVVGVGIKELKFTPGWNALENFRRALQEAVKTLDGASLTWEVEPSSLELLKPDSCGSRWFLEMKDESARLWCFAHLQYKGCSFYLLEVGREAEDNKLSISTLFSINKKLNASECIREMIINNGHWQKEIMGGDVYYLPHRHLNDTSKWGLYIADKIKS